VSLFLDYDAQDSAPPTESWFKNNKGAVSASIWSPVRVTCDLKDLNKAFKERYVRTGSLQSAGDIKTYDFGKLYVAVKGTTSELSFGDLWFDYDLELNTPQMRENIGASELIQGVPINKDIPFSEFTDNTGDSILARNTTYNNSSTFKFLEPGYYYATLVGFATGTLGRWIIESVGDTVITYLHSAYEAARKNVMNWFKIYVPNTESSQIRFRTDANMIGDPHCELNITRVRKDEYEGSVLGFPDTVHVVFEPTEFPTVRIDELENFDPTPAV